MLERALSFSGGKGQIGRVHFARAMVQENICEDVRDVFSGYLVKGKPGYVEHCWPSLRNVVSLILEANGLPIIAHPARYKLSYNLLTYMLEEFISFGGVGIEVATGSHSSADIERFKKFNDEIKIKIINESIRNLRKNYYDPRTRKVSNLLKIIEDRKFKRATLGGCIFFREKDKLCVKIEKK